MAEPVDTMQPEPMDPEQAKAIVRDKLKAIAGRMESEATKRVGQKSAVERRAIEDLEQYWGQYDRTTAEALKKGNKSKLYINMTRPKTDAMAARLMDLLFPTDDKNWGIGPTPVPTLTEAASKAAAAARQLQEQARQAAEQAAEAQADPNDPAAAQKQQQAVALNDAAKEAQRKADELAGIVQEATTRADNMSAEIDDQLKESNYNAVMRDVIEDACKIGTGVCKGPITGDRVRKGWQKAPVTDQSGQPVPGPDGQPQTSFQLQMSEANHPSMRYVDFWSFFPDMDAKTVEESEGVFERHLLNKKRLRALSKLPGFDKDAIRRLINGKAITTAPSYLADLRNLSGSKENIANDLYHVWEYSGPLSVEDMRDLALGLGDLGTISDIEDADPLAELNAIVWFCQGEVLKFAVYPFDSGECMYSVFNLAKDESSIFGLGIPRIISDPQRSLNSGWRQMMDNAALSTGPQILVAKDLVEPEDGSYEMTPRKIWVVKGALPQDRKAFDTFDIPMHQQELANVIEMSKQFIDDMASMPAIAQGEQGSGVTKTAQGMALLMNSTNVVFRRIVKNFDDDMTTPNIRRFYDWNMQFNPKEEIKGDYDIDARGSSVLLVREMQAQNLMIIATQLSLSPVYGPMLKNRNVLRQLFKAQGIPASEVVLSDDEIDAALAKAAADAQAQAQAAQPQPPPEDDGSAAEIQVEIANMEAGTKLRLAEIQAQIEASKRETAMIMLAEKMNMNVDQIEAKLAAIDKQTSSKERIMAAEVAVERANPANGGSGGYISQ